VIVFLLLLILGAILAPDLVGWLIGAALVVIFWGSIAALFLFGAIALL
jgi:hypothetical protein